MNEPELDDAQCFELIRTSPRSRDKAFRALQSRYLRRFLGRLREWRFDEASRKDVVQDVFKKLLSADLSHVESPRAYLWMMLRNTAMDELRRRKRAPTLAPTAGRDGEDADELDKLLDRAGTGDSFTPDIEADLLQSEQERADEATGRDRKTCFDKAWKALETRSPAKAHAIQLADFDGLTGQELATALSKTRGAAAEFRSQAKKLLINITQEICPDLFASMLAAEAT